MLRLRAQWGPRGSTKGKGTEVMKSTTLLVPIAALTMALGSLPAEAQRNRPSEDRSEQRAERRERGNQGPRQGRERADSRSTGDRDTQDREPAYSRSRSREDRAVQDRGRQSFEYRDRDSRAAQDRSDQWDRGAAGRDGWGGRGDAPAAERSRIYRKSDYDRGRYADRRDSDRYYAPRVLPRRSAPRRYYGSGGRLSLYFGWGSGYRYGAPYYGRVYGYRGPAVSYRAYRYYGDVRLKVRPRDAAVYVDGYYAGIVDDFDGFFQRLTLEVGPHQIEIEAPGLEPEVFDVYVDSSRTIDLHADLLR